MKTVVWLGVLAAAGAALAWLGRVLAIGAAYKAKVLASALFVSGLEIDPERADEVSAEAYGLMRLFRARVDRDAKTVTASLFGLGARTAVYRPGYGATLALGPLAPISPASPPRAGRAWPRVGPEAPALARVVDAAFAEPERGPLRRTRAVLVVRDGRIVAERYAPGISAATPLNGWSMSKGAIAALIGTLVGEGRLALTDTKLLAEWRGPADARGAISLEDLLRMRSGLRFSEDYSDFASDVNRMLWTVPDAAGYAAARPLAAPPGAKWQYASGTSNILSLIARRAVGEDAYLSWPRRALFDPLGMESAVFEPDASGTFVGSSFLFATARDWARFGLLHAQDGVWDGRRVLPEGWARLCATPTPQSREGCYGAHWWLKLSEELGGRTPAAARIPADAFHALGHEGQCLTVVPSRRLVALRLGLSIDITAWNHAAFIAGVLEALER